MIMHNILPELASSECVFTQQAVQINAATAISITVVNMTDYISLTAGLKVQEKHFLVM